MLGMPIVGFDRYTSGSGQMRWRLLDAVPVMGAEGPDVTRSATGRYAGELLLYAPTAGLSDMITWRPVDEARATAVLQVGSTQVEVTITVSATGVLTDVVSRAGAIRPESHSPNTSSAPRSKIKLPSRELPCRAK
jgi:hypothetical protein